MPLRYINAEGVFALLKNIILILTIVCDTHYNAIYRDDTDKSSESIVRLLTVGVLLYEFYCTSSYNAVITILNLAERRLYGKVWEILMKFYNPSARSFGGEP